MHFKRKNHLVDTVVGHALRKIIAGKTGNPFLVEAFPFVARLCLDLCFAASLENERHKAEETEN